MQPPATRALLTINVVFYVLWLLLLGRFAVTGVFVQAHLALHPQLAEVVREPWQLLTYNFLHLDLGFGGFLQVLFNMLWLVWIGRDFEEMQGSHRLLAIYIIAGIGGGLIAVAVHNLWMPGFPFISGAGTAVLGIMTAVATFYPQKSIGLLFIGAVRLVYLVAAVVVIELLFFVQGGPTSVAANIGGVLFGFLFAKAERSGLELSAWARVFFRPLRQRTVPRHRMATVREQPAESILGKMEGWFGSRAETPKRTHPSSARPRPEAEPTLRKNRDSLQLEVDRILDKISSDGYESLSDEEKRLLYEASRR